MTVAYAFEVGCLDLGTKPMRTFSRSCPNLRSTSEPVRVSGTLIVTWLALLTLRVTNVRSGPPPLMRPAVGALTVTSALPRGPVRDDEDRAVAHRDLRLLPDLPAVLPDDRGRSDQAAFAHIAVGGQQRLRADRQGHDGARDRRVGERFEFRGRDPGGRDVGVTDEDHGDAVALEDQIEIGERFPPWETRYAGPAKRARAAPVW